MQTLQKTPVSATERTGAGSLRCVHVLPGQSAVRCGRDGSAARGPRARSRAWQRRKPTYRLQAPRIVEAQNEQSKSRLLGGQSRQGARTSEARCRILPVEGRRIAPQYLYSSNARISTLVESGSCSRWSMRQVRIGRETGSTPHAGICARPARLRGQEPRRRAPTCGDYF